MRDQNLNFSSFSIQFEKELKKTLRSTQFFANRVLDTPTLGIEKLTIRYPQDFRRLRALCIALWFFPEELHWKILLDLLDKKFSQLNKKQRIEISIYLSSKENMLLYLFETRRFTSNQIFGNFLRSDLKDSLRILRICREKRKVRNTIRRRGYKDHGSRKPVDHWLPSEDFSFTEIQNRKERLTLLQQKYQIRIISYLSRTYLSLFENFKK